MRLMVARILAPAAAAVALGTVAAGCYDDYWYDADYAVPVRTYVAPAPARVYVPPPPACRRVWVPSAYDVMGRYHPGYWRCM
jgi:hypothetical protein